MMLFCLGLVFPGTLEGRRRQGGLALKRDKGRQRTFFCVGDGLVSCPITASASWTWV